MFLFSLKNGELMRKLKMFALNASREYGEQVATALGKTLSKHKESTFHDGEVYAASEENVRGCDVYVVQSLYGDNKESVNDKLMKLFVFIGSLHDASAAKVTAVLPYYCYGRQDRKTSSRAPITTKYMAHMLQSVFTKRVLTIDAHNPGVLQNTYSIAHFDNLEASGLLAKYVAKELYLKDSGIKFKGNLTVLSPDEGRLKQSRKFRKQLQQFINEPVGIACIDKIHDGEDIHSNGMIGTVEGKHVIILDDMISSGKTIIEAVNEAKGNHAASVFAVCATHGLFVGDANSNLDSNFVQNIVVTDTVKPFRVTNPNVVEKLSVINTANLFAEAIRRTHEGESISDLIEKNGIPLSFKKMQACDLLVS
jgi:ribose-phosphate pyrophosphokinase